MPAGLGSCNTLALLSVHRYIVVSLPTKQQWLSTNLSLGCGVLAVAGLTLAVALPPLLGWGNFAPETSGMSCAPDWESRDSLGYTCYLFCIGFVLPMSVILVTSVRVTRTMKTNSCRAHDAGVLSQAKKKEDKVRAEHCNFLLYNEHDGGEQNPADNHLGLPHLLVSVRGALFFN